MSTMSSLGHALPARQSDDPARRLIVFGIRQMGANGLQDAAAANAFLMAFGKDFRRPLVLLRALMAEMSALASGPIQIAPWCCPRMTAAEAAIVETLAVAERDPERARLLLGDLLGNRKVDGAAATARAVAGAFADLALPIG